MLANLEESCLAVCGLELIFKLAHDLLALVVHNLALSDELLNVCLGVRNL